MNFLTYRFKRIFKHSLINLVIFSSAILFANNAFAEAKITPFTELSPEIQEVLSPFADSWEQIEPRRQQMLIRFSQDADPEMRQRIKRHASHWKSLPIKERKKVRKAMRKFDKLPAHKREKLLKRWRDMPAEKRRKIHGAFDTFEQLPEERRREIREKVRNMSPEERREFLKEIAQQSTQSTTEAGEEKSQP